MSSTLTTSELQTASGLSYDTILRAARHKKLRGDKVTDATGWRFSVVAVERWAEKYLRPAARDKVLASIKQA